MTESNHHIFTGGVKRLGQGRLGQNRVNGPIYGPWVYIIAAPEVDRFKIGYTCRAPLERLADFETGSPVELRVVCVFLGEREDELALQREFRHSLIRRREWFRGIAQILDRLELPWVLPGDHEAWFINHRPNPDLPDGNYRRPAPILANIRHFQPSKWLPE